MEKVQQKIRYFLYARKSSESEDRQIQSIDDQVNRLKQLADNLHLDIKQIYTESKSAKKPNNRPVFDEVIRRIESSEAEGILCWQINRLSRNPIDSGKISWLLQCGILKSIQTIDRQYLPDDNVLLFNVEAGSANQFILDLSKNTKRGLQGKLERGWLPSKAPLGYLNDKLNKTITNDSERFNIVRKMWDMMLTGNYSPPEILDIATKEWGLRTRQSKKGSNIKLSKSGIYRIFTNIFYVGIIDYKKERRYEGKHEPMITLEEYDRVQVLLGRKGRPRPQKHKFAFTGAIRCGECGCCYTAEKHMKIIKKIGQLKEFTYYHCTRRTRRVICKQRKSVSEEKLELLINYELKKYTILPEFLNWALEELNRNNDREIEDGVKIHEAQNKALATTQKELDELTKMRYRQLIDDNTFVREKNALQAKISHIKEILRESETHVEQWLELTERTFKFANYAQKAFIAGGLELKKEILLTLGKTLIIKDQKLFIEPYEWLVPIRDCYPTIEDKYLGLELNKMHLNTAQIEALTTVRTQWGRIVKDVRKIIEQSEGKFNIPDVEPKSMITSKAA